MIENPLTISPVNQTYRIAETLTLSIPAGATTASVTPTPNTFLHEVSVSITSNATLATSAIATIQLTLDTVLVREEKVYISSVSGNRGRVLDTGSVNFADINFPVGTGDLVATISLPLAKGELHVNAYFTS